MHTIEPNHDGFFSFDNDSSQLTFNNVSLFRNQISPFFVEGSEFKFNASKIMVDGYYGLGYDAKINYPIGIYGRTNDIPAYSGDALANYGFLRTPFRRIPRFLVHNRKELDAFLGLVQSADRSLRSLFRGQVREYYLRRDPATLSILYDDPNALEPSLLPSASRAGIQLEDIAPEWSTLVQLFIYHWVTDIKSYLPQKDATRIGEELTRLVSSYQHWVFLLSLAQHYGLPSAGLDVTDKIDVALFFALHEFSTDPNNPAHALVKRRGPTGEPSVIYYFADAEGFFIDFQKLHPFGFPLARPDAQNANFLHTGWGLASNAIAQRLFMAIYLDPAGDWGPLPSTSELFPDPASDHFGRFLGNNLDKGSLMFRKFTEKFYWAYDR